MSLLTDLLDRGFDGWMTSSTVKHQYALKQREEWAEGRMGRIGRIGRTGRGQNGFIELYCYKMYLLFTKSFSYYITVLIKQPNFFKIEITF